MFGYRYTLLVVSWLALNHTGTCRGHDLVCQIIESYRYSCERHYVHTVDGYQLTLHRIPPPQAPPQTTPQTTPQAPTPTPSNSTDSNRALKRPQRPFLLMHGLLGSASDFVLAGKRRSIGGLLHAQGYDVWLANARGTTHSKRHRDWDSSNAAFWNFTWHEIGARDLPAIVDYVLAATGHDQLHYVAHSQGSTVLFVLLCERPEYNERIASAALLAPIAFLSNIPSPPVNLLVAKYTEIEALLNHLGLEEIFPSTALNQLGGHLFCGSGMPTRSLCLLLLFTTVGFSEYEMDRELLPRIFETTPAGISRRQFAHFGQLIQSGKFQQFDHNSAAENLRHYQRPTPPAYNLANVRVPLKMFYGSRDLLLAKQDVMLLTRQLRNARYSLHEVRGFNHIDLLYSSEAPRFIYKEILKDTKRYYR